MEYLTRAVDSHVEGLLKAFPAVLVVGPRACGKTTSMRRLASQVINLDVPSQADSARADPDDLIARYDSETLLVDEWQEVPEILGALKRSIDSNVPTKVGKFIITGSVRGRRQQTGWAGTGRFIRVKMFGLTQAELSDKPNFNPINRLFSKNGFEAASTNLTRSDYINLICASRFPDALKLDRKNRRTWLGSYVSELIDEDATKLTEKGSVSGKLKTAFGSTAARTAQLLNISAVGNDANIDSRTAEGYLQLLEDLGVVFRLPAWHNKRLKRLVKSPKVHISDAGLAAHLLSSDAEVIATDAQLAGQLFETFVAGEIVTHAETSTEPTDVMHFRNQRGLEVDLVIQQGNDVAGVEVKSGTRVSIDDAKGLIHLRDALGENFVRGVIFYTGTTPRKITERIVALPIRSLWAES